MAQPFSPPAKPSSAWLFAGLASSYPDISVEGTSLSEEYPCNIGQRTGCRIFQVPRGDSSQSVEVELDDPDMLKTLKDQVLVFRYRGKLHAIDHVSVVS
jgi:hypothetical protein